MACSGCFDFASNLNDKRHKSTKKGLANELKRSKGKLTMMRKLKLLAERSAEESVLMEKATKGSTTGGRPVKSILNRLGEIYEKFKTDHLVSSTLQSLRGIYGGSALLAAGHSIHEYLAEEVKKPDSERESGYRVRNLPFLIKRLTKKLRDVHLPHEADLLVDCYNLLDKLKASCGDDEVLSRCLQSTQETILKNAGTAKGAAVGDSKLLMMVNDPVADCLSEIFSHEIKTSLVEAWLEDPFVKVATALWEAYQRDRDSSKALISERDVLLAELLEYQQQGCDEEFYPDCNVRIDVCVLSPSPWHHSHPNPQTTC